MPSTLPNRAPRMTFVGLLHIMTASGPSLQSDEAGESVVGQLRTTSPTRRASNEGLNPSTSIVRGNCGMSFRFSLK